MRPQNSLLGTIVTMNNPQVTEIMSLVGFDWILIDMEHSTLSIGDAQKLVQAVGKGCKTIVRIPANQPVWIKRILEIGCDGIMIPLVNSVQEAKEALYNSKYPPTGGRSVGISRSHKYGLEFSNYVEKANSELITLIQIEHIKGVENIDDILQVDGIDGVFIGPYDLSGSLNLLGNVKHDKVQKAIDKVKKACKKSDIPYGIFTMTPELMKKELEEGCKYALVGIDTVLLANNAKKIVEQLKS